MFTDNPTYFSVAAPGSSSGAVAATSSQPRGLTSFFRRKGDKMGSTSSSTPIPVMASAENDRTEEAVGLLTHNGSSSSPSTSSAGQPARRSFRNLFRSVSANSDPEKTQQFLNGDPRPSDVAPPSPYLPHRSHSHSENDRRRPGRKKILKSASELLSNDMVYCGLPGEETPAENSQADGNGEVFLGVDDARYYNISATLPTPGSAAAGRRRHSIGTFLNKTQHSNQNGKKIGEPLRLPDTIAPPVPTADREISEPDCGMEPKVSRRRRHRSASSKGESEL